MAEQATSTFDHAVAPYLIALGLIGVGFYMWNRSSDSSQKPMKYGVAHEKPSKDSSATYRSRFCTNGLVSKMDGVSTLHDFLTAAVKKHGKERECSGTRPLINIIEETKIVNGEKKKMQYYHLGDYQWITFGEYEQSVIDLSSGLAQLGVGKGKKLALFEETRNEWTVAAQAAFRQSACILTAYANLGDEALSYALNLGEVEVILANASTFAMLAKIIPDVKTLKTIVYLDDADDKAKQSIVKASGRDVNIISYDEVVQLGKKNPAKEMPPKPDDVAVIMFTSGTTGMPKGVVLTHSQVVSAIGAGFVLLKEAIHLDHNDVYLSFLPLAHILAFVVHYVTFYLGCRIGYGSTRTAGNSFVRNCDGDIKTLRPTVFVGVPTVMERIKKEVERKLSHSSLVARAIFQGAYWWKSGTRASGGSTPILDRLVFDKFKETVGGRVRLMVSGGAYLSPDVQAFIETCFGVKVVQGYGLTETCGPACFQEPSDLRVGTVGAPFPSVEVKLVDVPQMGYTHDDEAGPRGEIWIRGNSVTSGYYKNEEETKKALTEDGWFKTGDVGQWTPEGTLLIVDRVKNLIKPPHGEYIAVERLESIYRDVSCVEQILVYVDNQHNEVVAVVVPQEGALHKFAEEKNIDTEDFGKLTKHEEVRKWVLKELQTAGRQKGLKSIETVRAVHVASDDWTPENGMLTAANKVKRKPLEQKYKKEIDEMYAELAKSSNE